MKTLLKAGILAQSFVVATIMQTVQAEDLFTVYLQAKESDPQIRVAEANYLATIEKGPQALADFKPKVTLTGSARYAAGSAVESTSTYFLNIQTGLNQIAALRKSYAASQTASRATQEGFKAGTRTAVDVILSVRETFRVERNYIAANYDFLLNTIRLKQAAGILSETDLQVISNIMNRPRSVRLSALKRF